MERDPRFPIPPGYVPWGEQGMRLVDPVACPAGHPWATDGSWARGYAPCSEHRGHPSWRCHCGREQFLRKDGVIVEEMPCVDPNYGQQRRPTDR